MAHWGLLSIFVSRTHLHEIMDNKKTELSSTGSWSIDYKLSDLPTLANTLLSTFQGRKVWVFDATMGSGKTTLINEICKQLNITEITSSPTFAIVNEYQTATDDRIYHIDCYRLEDLSEAYRIGLNEYIESGDWCFIEWPSVIGDLLEEEDTVRLQIDQINEGRERRLTYLGIDTVKAPFVYHQ